MASTSASQAASLASDLHERAVGAKVRARRERVAALCADGRNAKEVALELGMAVYTIREDARALGIRFQQHRDAAGLTNRMNDVLGLVAEGLTDTEIGARLFVSKDTVRTHMKKALLVLGARNRTHAAVLWTLANQQRRLNFHDVVKVRRGWEADDA